MKTQEDWGENLLKFTHKKIRLKNIVKFCVKSIALIASITAGSQLPVEALPNRADAWNFGECNTGTFLYVQGSSWYSFSRVDGWLYGGVAKKFDQYIVVKSPSKNQQILLYPKKDILGCMDFVFRSQHGAFD